MHVGGVVPAGLTKRTVLVSNAEVTLAELLDGDQAAVDAVCEKTFDEDPDDRPVLFRLDERRAAVLATATGELLGTMVWRARPYGDTMGCTAWNLGIKMIPTARGHGLGPAAGLLLIGYLFDTTELNRVEAYTETANIPGQRGLEKIGFHREGVSRGVHLRGGKHRDLVLYSLLRSDVAPATRIAVAARDGVVLVRTRPGDCLDLLDDVPGDMPGARGDEPLGTAAWHTVSYAPALGAAVNVTIGLTPAARPRAATAYRLLAEHLFTATGHDRVETTAAPDDLALCQALEQAGFRLDGRIRGAGQRQDVLLYGILRTDPATG